MPLFRPVRSRRMYLFVGASLLLIALLQLSLGRPAPAWNPSTSRTLVSREQQAELPPPLLSSPHSPDWYANQSKVTVVMWDGYTPWTWAQGDTINPPNYGGYKIVKEKCPVQCEWSTDRTKLAKAEAVLFDVCGAGPHEWKDVPVYFPAKWEGQRWFYYAYEQENYFPMLGQKEYTSQMDGSISYRHDSFEQISYVCPWGGFDDFLAPAPPKSKDKIVAFITSNCALGGATERLEYVKELMKYIQVDSYGHCLNNMQHAAKRKQHGWSNGGEQADKIELISEYKFLLAFENSDLVDDYVTEKFVNALQAGTVPVYRGSPTIDRWLPGDKSIVNTRDFPSPKALAEYLHKLNDDDEAYAQYFSWKQKGLRPSFVALREKCLFYIECRLCKRLAELRADEKRPSREALPSPPQLQAIALNRLDWSITRLQDDWISVQSDSVLDLRTNYTLMAWINPNVLGDGRIIDKNTAGAFDGYMLDVLRAKDGKGHLRFCSGNNCYSSLRALRIGVWYHVAVVMSPSSEGHTISMFINGKLDTQFKTQMATNVNTLPMAFGRAASGGSSWRGRHVGTVFDGLLDEISIWRRSLTPREVMLAQWSKWNGDEAGLVGYWPFDDGTAKDLGPYHLHGSVMGAPSWVPSFSKPLNDVSSLESQ